jgi:hypothetical protein
MNAVPHPASRDEERGRQIAVVAHSGREFHVSQTMARMFVRQARRVLRHRTSELVVLVHDEGVELLPITSITPFTVSLSTIREPSELDRPAANEPAADDAGPSLLSIVPDPLAMASMPLRLVGPAGTIATVQTVVVHVGDSTYEIQLDGRVIGFIRRTGEVFAAHVGPDRTSGSGWRQWRLWDKAAAFLVRASGLAPAESGAQTEPRPSAPDHDAESVRAVPGDRIDFSA